MLFEFKRSFLAIVILFIVSNLSPVSLQAQGFLPAEVRQQYVDYISADRELAGSLMLEFAFMRKQLTSIEHLAEDSGLQTHYLSKVTDPKQNKIRTYFGNLLGYFNPIGSLVSAIEDVYLLEVILILMTKL